MPQTISADDVHAGLNQALDAIAALQGPDGSWPGENLAGAFETGLFLLFAARAGRLEPRDLAGCRAFLRDVQRADGGFPLYQPGGPSDVQASVAVWAGLLQAGVRPDDPVLAGARTFARDRADEIDDIGSLYLALAGEEPIAALPSDNLHFRLIPGFDRLLGRRFSFGVLLAATEVPAVRRQLAGCGGLEAARWLDRISASSAASYIRARQNPAGDWAGVLVPTLWGCAALQALGLDAGHPSLEAGWRAVDRHKHWTGDRLQLTPYRAEVWNTALMSRLFLRGERSEGHRALAQHALAYLRAQQSWRPAPRDWQRPRRGAPRHGGWPYEQGNALCCDCDSTGAVLWTLGLARSEGDLTNGRWAEAGMRWLLGMQNEDGGWAAFARGLGRKPPGPIFTRAEPFAVPRPAQAARLWMAPPLAMQDPATAELTGRVLSALGAWGYRHGHPRVAAAVEFLRRQQGTEGAWWGRWEVNFVPATGAVLSGLAAVGIDARTPWVQNGVSWLLAAQHADGGWGESHDTYRDPALAGEGPSHPWPTGIALLGLIDAGQAAHPAVARGVRYLLRAQGGDGLWGGDEALFVMVPPTSFYSNRVYAQTAPAEALWRYVEISGGNT